MAGYVTGECTTIDGGEWLKAGGEFNRFTDHPRDEVKALLKLMRG